MVNLYNAFHRENTNKRLTKPKILCNVFTRPNQDNCPGYEYYNAMTTNLWQDDMDNREKGTVGPGPSPSPSPAVSQWPSCKIQFYRFR